MTLPVIWFLLIVVLIIGYAILDGFDLGVGVMHLFARDETERRVNINAIGPVWDGNEVWLIAAGGGLFAAFPAVYATALSSLYLAIILLMVALVFRACAIEFRGHVDSPLWRRFWDWGFGLGSLVVALLVGVAVGNVVGGMPIDRNGQFTGAFFGLLNAYALVVGLTGLVMFVTHGAIYMAMKTEGEHRDRMGRWAVGAWTAFAVLYVLATIGTFVVTPLVEGGLFSRVLFWPVWLVTLAAIVATRIFLAGAQYGRAFIASAVTMAGLVGATAVGLFPKWILSSTDPAFSLDLYKTASGTPTLTVMLVVALVGVPLVLLYTICIYRVFRGPVKLTQAHY